MARFIFSTLCAFLLLFSAGPPAGAEALPGPSMLNAGIPSEGFACDHRADVRVRAVPLAPEPGLQGAQSPVPEHKPREVLVKFQPAAGEEEKEDLRQRLGAERARAIRSLGVEHWRLPEELTTEQALAILGGEPAVDYAEPNYLRRPEAVPDDPFFDRLWHLFNTGQEVNTRTGTAGADIAAPEAWDMETGAPNVVIAVLDTGAAYDHPDLAPNVWTNAGEVPANGLDDDGNGYVDDVHGWDFVNADNDPSDYSRGAAPDGHGTHVAGIIGAVGNNAAGITGVMWNTRIMPLQVSHFPLTSLEAAAILEALAYAVDNGARVINCSFSGTSYSQLEYDALSYADQQGVLVVAAAGNSSPPQNNDVVPAYPASYDLPNIIAVAATDENDALAPYSNFGPTSVDLAAPGGADAAPNVYSALPPDRAVLFADDFTDAGQWDLSQWTGQPWAVGWDPAFGSNVLADSFGGPYLDNEMSRARTKTPIDITDHRGILAEYFYEHYLEYRHDYVHVELSEDGSTFAPIISYTGNTDGIYYFQIWSTTDFENVSFYLGFSLESDGSVTDDGIYISDVMVTGIPWHYDGDEYGYKSGTSMATALVSGAAGLVWSRNRFLTHYQVKDILLNSVDPLGALAGKVGSGGRLNAYGALLATPAASSFDDVSPSHWAWDRIETLYRAGITKGCAESLYCPEDVVTRAQMAVFLERGRQGRGFEPPPASGLFGDVPTAHWAAAWIEQLYADGITKGCSAAPLLYCPESPVTRAEMAVFLMRAVKGPAYSPPPAAGIFADVPVDHWAADWIEALYAEGITTGCAVSPLAYCPEDPVTRAQMAVFLVRAFGL